jgi:hypothetical protein
MVYNTRNYWVFGLCPSSGILKNTMFHKLICFRPQVKGWETPTLLGPLESHPMTAVSSKGTYQHEAATLSTSHDV